MQIDLTKAMSALRAAAEPGRAEQMAAGGNIAVASVFGSILPAAWSYMLAARNRGLGTCWTTVHLMHEEEAAEILGGYMVIKNHGSEPDRLIGGSASFAGKVEVHEMKMDGDVMKMREIKGGLEIPAGGSVTLKPGGLHVMFMKLTEQMNEGETRTVTLEFDKAGSVEMELPVKVVKPGHSGKHNH